MEIGVYLRNRNKGVLTVQSQVVSRMTIMIKPNTIGLCFNHILYVWVKVKNKIINLISLYSIKTTDKKGYNSIKVINIFSLQKEKRKMFKIRFLSTNNAFKVKISEFKS